LKLLEPWEAIEVVYSFVGRNVAERVLLDSDAVDITDLYGRLIAEPVKAVIPQPPTPRSTLDGYAVSVADLIGASKSSPVKLRVSGYSRIGDSRVQELEPGGCIQVDTGSIIPRGADAVVPVEDVVVDGGYAIFTYTPEPGSGLALPASDVSTGDVIVPRGARGYPEVVAALASQGYRRVKASRRVRVAILSTGDELLEPGTPYRVGGVFESNRFYLSAIMRALGYEVVDLGIVADDPHAVEEALFKAATLADIVVTSGGTSVGVRDYIYKVLEARGRMLVRGLRVKPGKPTIVGLLGETPIVGISGNPRATVNITWSFLIPLLDRLGLPAYLREPAVKDVVLALPIKLDKRRRLSLPLAVVETRGETLGFPVAVESYMIASLPKADSKAELERGEVAQAGSIVKALNYRYPEPTLIALTDTRLIDLGALNVRVVTSIVENAEQVIGRLRGSNVKLLVSSTQLGSLEDIGIVEWRAKREIVLVGRSTCRKTAVFKPYSSMYKAGITAERAETASILVDQGYVDCAVIPEDYRREELEVVEVIGVEEVKLITTSTPP